MIAFISVIASISINHHPQETSSCQDIHQPPPKETSSYQDQPPSFQRDITACGTSSVKSLLSLKGPGKCHAVLSIQVLHFPGLLTACTLSTFYRVQAMEVSMEQNVFAATDGTLSRWKLEWEFKRWKCDGKSIDGHLLLLLFLYSFKD